MATMPLSTFMGMAGRGDAYYNRRHIIEVTKTRRGYDLLLSGPNGEADAEWVVVGYDALIEVRRSPGDESRGGDEEISRVV
jgi:hypothetical protein